MSKLVMVGGDLGREEALSLLNISNLLECTVVGSATELGGRCCGLVTRCLCHVRGHDLVSREIMLYVGDKL